LATLQTYSLLIRVAKPSYTTGTLGNIMFLKFCQKEMVFNNSVLTKIQKYIKITGKVFKIVLISFIFIGGYMRYAILIFSIFLINCVTNKEFIDYYSFIKENNINLNYSIDDSVYVSYGRDDDYYIDNDNAARELTDEQRIKLNIFLEMFELDYRNIENIIHRTAFKYDVLQIVLFDYWRGGYSYCLCTNFYSTERLAEHSKYDDEYKCWKTFNIALYVIEDNKIRFTGWHI
jgi:hypothetical protein